MNRLNCKLIIVITFMFFSASVYAAEYKLVRGQQYELCREFEKNLNSFKNEPPMVCERKLNPEFKNFWKPKWKDVDSQNNMGIINRFSEYKYQKNKYEKTYLKNWEKILTNIDEGVVSLQIAFFDLDFDGRDEPVYKLKPFRCDPAVEYYVAPIPYLFVMNKNNKILNTKYRRIFRSTYDPFFYKGRIYLSESYGLPKHHINIYEPFNTLGELGVQNKPICRYNYKTNK